MDPPTLFPQVPMGTRNLSTSIIDLSMSSLEGIIDFSTARAPLHADQRAHAKRKFYHIVGHFKTTGGNSKQYNRPLLVRLTYEYARSEESQDVFLRAFFQSMALSLDIHDLEADHDVNLSNKSDEADLRSALFGFADYLIDNFFLPRKPTDIPSQPLFSHPLQPPAAPPIS